jgi:hypothetical protein
VGLRASAQPCAVCGTSHFVIPLPLDTADKPRDDDFVEKFWHRTPKKYARRPAACPRDPVRRTEVLEL